MRKIIPVVLVAFLISCAGNPAEYKSCEIYSFNGKKKGSEAVSSIVIINNETAGFDAEITSPLIPAFTVTGEAFFRSETIVEIMVEKVVVLSNWPNGWTYGEWEASGKITLQKSGDVWICRVMDQIELWEIMAGGIRYYDDYYRKEDGIQKVKSRMDRIKAVCRHLHDENLFPDMFGSVKKDTSHGAGMNDLLMPYMFPEIAGKNRMFMKKPGRSELSTVEQEKNYVYGSDIRWRKDFTGYMFPEYLHEIRNSGTLWRDYEEAPELFMSVYNFNNYLRNVLDGISFVKDKKRKDKK